MATNDDLNRLQQDMLELLFEAADLSKKEVFLKAVEFINSWPNYAPFNMYLMFVQNPDMKYPCSTIDLKQLDRAPKSGVRPVAILKPFWPVDFVYDLDDTMPLSGSDDEMNQKALEYLERNKGNAHIHAERWFMRLWNYLARNNISLLEGDSQTMISPDGHIPDALAIKHKTKGNCILVRPGQLGPSLKEETIANVIHELAHHMLGHLGEILLQRKASSNNPADSVKVPDRRYLSQASHEWEAETVSHLVCNVLMLKTSAAEYLAHWNVFEGKKIPAIDFKLVLRTAHSIIKLRIS